MSLQEIIQNDIFNILKHISNNFDIPINILIKRYIPELEIYNKEKKKRLNYGKLHNYNLSNTHRCIARCWGGEKSVKYIIKEKKWIFGTKCKIRKYGTTNYCQTHLKQVKKKGHPDNGDFDKDVPHNHYNKYKKKIEIKFSIKYNL
jgi:hypothetical protein